MTDLVFLEPNKIDAVPFTTSKVIAEFAGIQHHTVTRLIQQYENDLKEFGSLRFQIEVSKREVGATTAKTYYLNEEQATLLITLTKKGALHERVSPHGRLWNIRRHERHSVGQQSDCRPDIWEAA